MILASGSQRRQEILKDIGFNFKVVVPVIDEVSDKESIPEKILDISYKKAKSVAVNYRNEFVLSADTVVCLEGEILGKPKNESEAIKFLEKLSGKSHSVITAYFFINLEKNIFLSDYIETKVKFNILDKNIIDWYIEIGEYKDKAGAYGIQGKGRVLVEKIEGDYFSVMGFPISNFLKNLNKIGLNISQIDKI